MRKYKDAVKVAEEALDLNEGNKDYIKRIGEIKGDMNKVSQSNNN